MINIIYISYFEFDQIKKNIKRIEASNLISFHVFESIDYNSAKNSLNELYDLGYQIKIYEVKKEPCIENHWYKIIKYYNFKNILLLCADETLLLSISDQIEILTYEMIQFPRENLIGNYVLKGGGWGVNQDYQIRFIKNPELIENKPRAHHLPFKVIKECIKSKLIIRHNSYENIAQFIDRFNRYTTLEATFVDKNVLTSYLIYRSFKHFFKRYIYQKGYRDGSLGFILSSLMAIYYATSIIKSKEEL